MFKSSKALQTHDLSHVTERPFGCDKCNQCFKSKVALKQHSTITHSEVKDFQCDQCSKPFVLNYQLQRHIVQVHAPKVIPPKRKFKCDQCDFETNEQHRASGLNIHKKAKHMEKTEKGKVKNCHDCSFESLTDWKMNQHKLKYHQLNAE